MKVEHALAARTIANAIASGYSKESAITQAAKFVKTQGFSAKYSKEVAVKMAELV